MRMVYKFKVTVEDKDGKRTETKVVVKSSDFVNLNREEIKEKLLTKLENLGYKVYYDQDYIRNLPMRIWHQVN